MDLHNPHPSNELSSFEQAQISVIVVPFPMQSHLNQLLQLSCLISSYKIPIHYACSATYIHQVKQRFNDINRLHLAQIHFHEFPTPHFLSPPPNPDASIEYPADLPPSFEATLHHREPMAGLLRKISPTARRVIVIHDVLMAYVVQDTATVPNAESYAFIPISAFSYFFDGWLSKGKPFPVDEPEGLPSTEACVPSEITNFVSFQYDFLKFTAGEIYNSCRLIEGTYVDLQAKQIGANKQVWAWPLILATVKNSNSQHKCLEWLDKQAPKSVLYVCFGSVTAIAEEQIKELAIGLEKSKQKFIWVLREADKEAIFAGDANRAQLPEGYEERVKEVGMVVRDWAPQLEILGQPSTGGFMSHCGWNSCLESITMGVPIAAWPMHSDQPKNAFLVTNMLKIGVAVKEWAQREELVTSSTIGEVVKRLMASKEGEEIRNRAEELGVAVRESVKEGGVSRMELDSFIAHITR